MFLRTKVSKLLFSGLGLLCNINIAKQMFTGPFYDDKNETKTLLLIEYSLAKLCMKPESIVSKAHSVSLMSSGNSIHCG